MNPTYALGIDAGPSLTGACLLRVDESGWAHIEWGAHLPSKSEELFAKLREAARTGALLVFEQLLGYAFEAKRVQALIETSRVEGDLKRIAMDAGATPLVLSAHEWRAELCRSKTASDAQIRIAVEGLTKTRTGMKASARAHIYDAAGVALVALGRARGGLTIPARIEGLIHLQREKEKADRAAKKLLPKKPKATKPKAKKRAWAIKKEGV